MALCFKNPGKRSDVVEFSELLSVCVQNAYDGGQIIIECYCYTQVGPFKILPLENIACFVDFHADFYSFNLKPLFQVR